MARPRREEVYENPLTIAHEGNRVDMKAMRDEESKLVKGRFRFYDPIGGGAEFYYKKYKGEHVQKFTLWDDQVYEIPLGVARHINENAFEEQHKLLMDENGKPMKGVKRKRRAEFIPLEFS